MVLRLFSVLLLCTLVVTGVAAGSNQSTVCAATTSWSLHQTATQEANTCISPDALTGAQTACVNVKAGQVCLGAGSLQTSPVQTLAVGASVELAGLDSLTGTSGSVALLKTQADLSADSTPVLMALYGDASITNVAASLPQPLPTITVINGPVNILNLRATPDQNGAVVTTMKWGESLTADGRSADSTWYRVQTEQGSAWVFASLIKVKAGDDPGTLTVLDSPITQPMQGVTLESSAGSCGGGLLVQAANKAQAHVQVNGALLTFSTATLLVQAQSDNMLDVQVISGSADVTANGQKVTAKSGNDAQVALKGSQAADAPKLQDSFTFASLLSAPLDLLPQESLTCLAGVTSGTAALYSTPGGQSAGTLGADSHVTVSGQLTLGGTTYYKVGDHWVAQDAVQTVGLCDALPQVSATTAQNTQTTVASNLVPTGRSIWTTETGPDNLSGTCISPPIAECSFLAALTPQSNGTINYLGQEPQPYTMHASGANSFSFQGRNQLNNANMSLNVTLTSATTWVGTMKLVYDNDSGCTHTFNYTASRMR